MKEEWKTIKDYPDYEVSNMGRVKSHKFKKERILKQTRNSAGYYHVCLYGDHKSRYINVHVLVVDTFIRPRKDGEVVMHRDHNKQNNRLENLQIGTPKENRAASVEVGHYSNHEKARGEQHGKSKLTDEQVREILALKGTATYQEIADMYGVALSTVSNILSRKIWKHVEIPARKDYWNEITNRLRRTL